MAPKAAPSGETFQIVCNKGRSLNVQLELAAVVPAFQGALQENKRTAQIPFSKKAVSPALPWIDNIRHAPKGSQQHQQVLKDVAEAAELLAEHDRAGLLELFDVAHFLCFEAIIPPLVRVVTTRLQGLNTIKFARFVGLKVHGHDAPSDNDIDIITKEMFWQHGLKNPSAASRHWVSQATWPGLSALLLYHNPRSPNYTALAPLDHLVTAILHSPYVSHIFPGPDAEAALFQAFERQGVWKETNSFDLNNVSWDVEMEVHVYNGRRFLTIHALLDGAHIGPAALDIKELGSPGGEGSSGAGAGGRGAAGPAFAEATAASSDHASSAGWYFLEQAPFEEHFPAITRAARALDVKLGARASYGAQRVDITISDHGRQREIRLNFRQGYPNVAAEFGAWTLK